MNLHTKINYMIDNHPEIPYAECPGCSYCDEVRELGKQLDKTPEERYRHLLDKGPEMTTNELKTLITNGVPLEVIQKKLGMSRRQFDAMHKQFRPKPNKKKNKSISPEEFIQERKDKMSNPQIAEKYGIEVRTLSHYVRVWVKKGAISRETLNSLPRTQPGTKPSTPLLTMEQYQYAKQQGWTKARMAREFKVGIGRVYKSIQLYEVAE